MPEMMEISINISLIEYTENFNHIHIIYFISHILSQAGPTQRRESTDATRNLFLFWFFWGEGEGVLNI